MEDALTQFWDVTVHVKWVQMERLIQQQEEGGLSLASLLWRARVLLLLQLLLQLEASVHEGSIAVLLQLERVQHGLQRRGDEQPWEW